MKTDDLFDLNLDDENHPDYEYFGVCPKCGKTDGYLNFRSDHFFVCDTHKLFWCAGANIFSSWQDEDAAKWDANAEKLSTFTEAEPVYNARLCDEQIKQGGADNG